MTLAIEDILQQSPIVPVIVIYEGSQALPLAEALLEAGLSTLEITLRTPCALEAIEIIKHSFPAINVGAGTVLNQQQLGEAVAAGADFIVSPGFTPALVEAAKALQVPILPGVNSPSEVMQLLDWSITTMKFFPAEPAGGVAMLKALKNPLPQARFCPTGGISPHNAADYLALSNVISIGGSWMVDPADVASGQWARITAMTSDALKLAKKI